MNVVMLMHYFWPRNGGEERHGRLLGRVNAAVEGGVDPQIAPKLDTGVGPRNVEEARPIERADPHIFDGLGLERKVGRLGAADGGQARGRAEKVG